MKKFSSIILALLFIITSSICSFASQISINSNNETIKYEDGSYVIISITTDHNDFYTTSKSAKKDYKFFNSKDELQWTATVYGTFSFNGTTSSCIKASTAYKIYNKSWKVKNSTASKKNNSAIGNFTIKHYMIGIPVQTETFKVTLSCKPNGTLY